MKAAVRLVTAIFTIVSVALELAIKLVQLLIAIVERAARQIEPPPASAERKRVAVAPTQVDEERLTGALTGMGFQAGKVRAYVAKTRGRHEPIEALVREGIAQLSGSAS